MDQDDTRRGGPSVHVALARRFRSPHAGACGAILAGDYLVALATRMITEASRGHTRQSELLSTFAAMQMATVAGQQLDSTRLSRDAEKVYELKTGSYTVAGPLELGAHLAGADRRTLGAIARFARPIGVAFQLRDDLLSLFAKSSQTGKPFANDLRVGKQTWTLQWTLENAKPAERKAVRAAFGNPSATRQQLRSALSAIRSSGAGEATEARLNAHTSNALRALSKARLNAGGEALLLGAARALIERGT
jgi:geranylgeranyl diphosphate synthase type I